VREQEQSFNVIDIATGGVTVSVHAWTGDDFTPKDALHYEWQNGKWAVGKRTEPA
jgi:hypothetical protein